MSTKPQQQGQSTEKRTPSLSQMYREHKDRLDHLQKVTENRKKVVSQSVYKVTDSMVDGINQGVARVFSNQKKIESETKHLENEAAKLHKQTNSWIQLIEDFSDALKEIGDVENWAQVIEQDMREVSSALEHVYRLSNPGVSNG